VQKT